MNDEELERRFDALMRRINDNHEAVSIELREHLRASEDRLMGRLNQQTERILDRLTALEGDVRNLRTEHTTTRDSVLALPMTVLRVIEGPLLGRITEAEARITKLERKD